MCGRLILSAVHSPERRCSFGLSPRLWLKWTKTTAEDNVHLPSWRNKLCGFPLRFRGHLLPNTTYTILSLTPLLPFFSSSLKWALCFLSGFPERVPYVPLFPNLHHSICWLSIHQPPETQSRTVLKQLLTYGPHLINAYWNKLNFFTWIYFATNVFCYPFFGHSIVLYIWEKQSNNINTNGAFIRLPGEQGWCELSNTVSELTYTHSCWHSSWLISSVKAGKSPKNGHVTWFQTMKNTWKFSDYSRKTVFLLIKGLSVDNVTHPSSSWSEGE